MTAATAARRPHGVAAGLPLPGPRTTARPAPHAVTGAAASDPAASDPAASGPAVAGAPTERVR